MEEDTHSLCVGERVDDNREGEGGRESKSSSSIPSNEFSLIPSTPVGHKE